MKKIHLVFIPIMSLFLSSCRPLDYGDKYENVRWTSIDPEIEFKVYDKQNAFNEGTLKIDDKEIDIYATWGVNLARTLFFADRIDINSEESLSENQMAVRGIYRIKKGEINLKVSLDNVFNFKYEYITFVMSEL